MNSPRLLDHTAVLRVEYDMIGELVCAANGT